MVPGTNPKTNRNAYEMIHHDTIFTNVGVTADDEPWWEGLHRRARPSSTGRAGRTTRRTGPPRIPNSRFTVSAKQNPAYSHAARKHPEGVPISAILFGGRRREVAPLVYEARDWAHGVMIGAGMASETTAAAIGQVGVVRRDSMAMKPFCGYNFARLLGALAAASKAGSASLPKVFHVNWFRQDKDGKFLWPGFGDNLRVLRWIIDRCEGPAPAKETPIGYLPRPEDIDLAGLALSDGALAQLMDVDPAAWHAEIDDIGRYLDEFGGRMPSELRGRSTGRSSARSAEKRGAGSVLELVRIASGALGSGSCPSPIRPWPCSITESRRTNASLPSSLVTNVPFVLWSTSRNLLRVHSIRACSREIRVPLTHDVVLLGAAHRQILFALVEHELAAEVAHAHAAWRACPAACRARSTAACWSRLPAATAPRTARSPRCMPRTDVDVDLARHGAPFGRQPLHRIGRQHDLPGLGLARHAIGGVHRGAEDVLVLEHDRAEVTADADRDVLPLHREFGAARRCPAASRPPHSPRRSPVGKIARISSPMVLMTVPRLRSVDSRMSSTHEQDHVARTRVAEQLVQTRAAHDVREQDGDFRLGASQAVNP